MHFHRISIIGLGYIGLPTAAVLSDRKQRVIGVDLNPKTVATINQGKIPILEPDLDQIVRRAVQEGFLRATTVPEPADAFLIAVPTPLTEHHKPDLSYIESAARSIAQVLKKGDLVILESTSPVGTTERMAGWLAEERPDLRFPQSAGEKTEINIAYCPERVLPGHILRELVENDRIIGGLSERCAERAVALYRLFVRGQCITTDARTAELCKLTENAFRDLNIAFANELSFICDEQRIDVWELIQLANHHPRVNILQPGPGVGGHCIAVDPWFIVDSAPEQTRLIRTAREVNDRKPHWVIEKVKRAVQGIPSPCIACLGLSFKADIDDLRESPALEIVSTLAREGVGKLLVVEPHIAALPPNLSAFSHVVWTDKETAIDQADIVLLLVNHSAFRKIDPKALLEKIIIDTRGFWRDLDPS